MELEFASGTKPRNITRMPKMKVRAMTDIVETIHTKAITVIMP